MEVLVQQHSVEIHEQTLVLEYSTEYQITINFIQM
jgi:hypothetical protein